MIVTRVPALLETSDNGHDDGRGLAAAVMKSLGYQPSAASN